MTEEDFSKISFKCVAHMGLADEHIMKYESFEYEPKISVCIHTPVEKYGWGKPYAHYAFNGTVYETKEEFLSAMTDFENENPTDTSSALKHKDVHS